MTWNIAAVRALPVVALLVASMMVVMAAACGSSDGPTVSPEPTVAPGMPPPTAAPTTTAPATSTPEPLIATTDPAPSAAPDTGPRQIGDVEGVTFEVGDGSEATFTVTEQLASLSLPNDAVVRTSALWGRLHLGGEESVIEIDLQSLSSDSSYRDRYIRERMFADHPTGVFTVQGFDRLPDGFGEGETVSAKVDGELTVRGVSVPLSFDVEARDDGDVVYVIGRTSFTWEQLQIPKPTARSVVSLEDEVRVEVLLSARPESASSAMAPIGSLPGSAAGGDSLLITRSSDGDPQAFLDQLPAGETACLESKMTREEIAEAIGLGGDTAPYADTITGCLEDLTLLRVFFGLMIPAGLEVSPESRACIAGRLGDEEQVAKDGEVVSQAIRGGTGAFGLMPLMLCFNEEEAALMDLDLDGIRQFQCFADKLSPEDLLAFTQLAATGGLPSPAVIAALQECAGPS